MMDTMLFTGLPQCSPENRHVLVVEESPNIIALELHNKEKGGQVSAKYFLPLHESHPLVIALSTEESLLVEKAEIRKLFGVTLSDFRTISAK